MHRSYEELVQRIAQRHGVAPEMVSRRAESRHARLRGCIGRSGAAQTVALSLAMDGALRRLEAFLAAGSRHVNGLQIEDAIAAAQAEAVRHNLITIGYWPLPGDTPEKMASHQREAIDAIVRAGLVGSSVSIKVDLMGYDRPLVVGVLQHARQARVRVHFDAQGIDTVDRTHALVEEGVALGAEVSATLVSRWQRSVKDAERFKAMGIALRIVKGQGGDPEHPKIDPRQAYLALVEQLAGSRCEVGVATHDRRVAEPALERLQAAGTPCVLEQLRSLPRLDFLATARGLPTRAYVAYGRFGLPYAIREAFRRPAIVLWILRDGLLRHRRVPRPGPDR